ncbi:MAG: UDP-3-O-(3-hydroxymyristoyl)glucosamine N-acyltransferase [Muribaculaceae bacterium]|nr:UDP-3-O-(3-hydroxymyristoyl)glucosamine N-acyltransferase [Muribaculaceae bacterium]
MEVSPSLIASIVKGTVEGDGEVKITGFAKIQEAKKGDITFLANPKYTHFIYSTNASAVLVRNDFVAEHPLTATLIRVEDPYVSLADLLTAMQQAKETPRGIETPVYISEGVDVPEDCYVGAFSYLGKGVRIGKNVRIYPQVYIGENVVIGDNSVIRAGVKIYEDCVIGKGCQIHSGCVIGADGFGFAPKPDGTYEKIPQIGNVVLEDDVEIGANTTVDRATFGSTRIGRGTKLDNLIQVAHNVEMGQANVVAAQAGFAGSSKIGNYNQIGGQVGVSGHIKIGDFNEIGAQSGIPNSVGSKKRIIGYPAVDARQFAKNLVYIKRLEELFRKL